MRLVHHDFRGPQPVAQGTLGRAHRVRERPAVREHPVHEILAGGAVRQSRRRCRPRYIPGRRSSVERRAVARAPQVDARPAHPLHGDQGDHGPWPLVPRCAAGGAAQSGETARGQHGLLGSPLAGQSADVTGEHPGLSLRPFGSLGLAIGLAEDVVLPFVEADGLVATYSLS